MIARSIRDEVEQALQDRAAVLLIGLPRVGRSALASTWVEDAESLAIVFDAARLSDRNDMAQTDPFLDMVAGYLVIIENIDEQSIDSVAELVRRAAESPGQTRFLLLVRRQPLAPKLATQLAGLVRSIELTPIQPDEAFRDAELLAPPPAGPIVAGLLAGPVDFREWDQDAHWLRGGLPDSLRAATDETSFLWRADYKAALLSGDFGDWGIGPADRVLDVLDRIVAAHGQIFNEATCQSELGLDRTSLRRSIDMLVRMGLVRSLPNLKRGHPVLYVRDSGLFHAMRGVRTRQELRTDQLHGHSWESFAAEALIVASGNRAQANFYRDKDDNEIDLVLDFGAAYAAICAIEFKVSHESDVEPGFWRACEDVRPTHKFVVHSRGSSRKCAGDIEALPLLAAIEKVQSIFS